MRNKVKQRVFDRTGHNEKLYNMLVEIGLRTIPQYMEKLEKYIKKSDYKELKITAHSLKGASLNLAISEVADIAGEIQNLATTENDIAKIEILYKKLVNEWEIVRKDLQ
ncbi:MAG: Hpt domain-containing protein [Spirochaetes bacterium]|nr:Hpt domain-containing protein [Spirochaetota bacterium]